MIKLNKYITEAWSGMKQHTLKSTVETWCDEMGIENYTINSKGEIDVDGDVNLMNKHFKELPYKFGEVIGFFDLSFNPNLISLKNCPYYVRGYFDVDGCIKLNSLEGCPKEIGQSFFCGDCKREFTIEEVQSLCDVKIDIIN